MSTPNFKLLLNALRLGQPQDPKAAVFVLAEALAKQDEQLEDLRKRLGVVQSHANLMEAKALRLESELSDVRAGSGHVAAHSGAPNAAVPYSAPPYAPALPPPASHRAPASHRPPPPSAPPPSSVVPHSYEMASAPLSAPPSPKFDQEFVDSYDDEESSMHTVVVRQQEVMALRSPEAPFRITSPSEAPRVAQPSIPGAPWARGAGNPRAVPMEDFTVDAFEHELVSESAGDLEGETYRDRVESRRHPRTTPPMDGRHGSDPADSFRPPPKR